MDPSTTISFHSEGLHVQAAMTAFDTIQLTWEGTFSHRDEPKDLAKFLNDVTSQSGEKIANIDFRFERLSRIRSGMITFLLRMVKELQADRQNVTLTYLEEGFQVKLFNIFQRSLEELVRPLANKARHLKFQKVKVEA